MKRRSQRGLGLSETDSGTQSAHDVDPIVVLSEVILGSKTKQMASSQQFIGVHWKIDIRSRRGIDAEEFRRRNADHGERQVVD